MNTNTATKVRTATGTVHAFTIGRTYYSRGETMTNTADTAAGKADCGAQTSFAATFTDSPVTCPKCAK